VGPRRPGTDSARTVEREGVPHRWIARHCRIEGLADTAVSIEREVVSGHADAILAPDVVTDVRCADELTGLLSRAKVKEVWA
jgi:hypothetical protein